LSHLLLLAKEKHVQKKAVSPDHHPAAQHIFRQLYFVHTYGLHVNGALVNLDSSGSPGVQPAPGLTLSIPSSVRVCRCIYTYTSTHHHNTSKNREIYKTKSLSLLLPKNSSPHQQQAPDMNQLKKDPAPNSLLPTHAGVET